MIYLRKVFSALMCENIYRISKVKRESGENPERSGHCKQGVPFRDPLCISMRRRRGMMICKSGNLLRISM